MGGLKVKPSWKGTLFLVKTHENSKVMLVPVITTNNLDIPRTLNTIYFSQKNYQQMIYLHQRGDARFTINV
jgi:hypothetical protein